MRIGIIADTHISAGERPLPENFLKHLRGMDLILHAGDLVVLDVLDGLKAIAPVEAVAGNMDSPAVRKSLPIKRIIQVEDVRLGLIHGWGAPWDLPQRVLAEFPDDVPVVIFGHSHQPYQKWAGERLLFNPGSVFQDRFSAGRSYGLLTVEGHQVGVEICAW